METYRIGQRWISDAESELGLGIVSNIENRRVEIEFGSSGIVRLYAMETAPLTRVLFQVGEKIASHDQQDLLIKDILVEDELLLYICETVDGKSVDVPEEDLDEHLQLNRPQEKLLGARIDQDAWFTLRYEAWHQQAKESQSSVYGLRGARIGLIPHQLYIASEVANRHSPRVLLADEVGLGKTIEAGLILHKLILDGQVNRVLLLLPESLMHQWLVEMLRRFNLRFSLFDEERLLACDSENPFHDEQLILCSLDMLVSNPHIARHALAGEWDFLVVDEAHHLHWSEEETGIDYDLVEAVAEQTQGVLLLTATPEQLGRAGHYGRLRLLDPARFPSYEQFVNEEAGYADIAVIASKLLENELPTPAEEKHLDQLLGELALGSNEEVINALVDRHGTGRVLFRNRRQGIAGFPGRELNVALLDLPQQYAEAKIQNKLTPEFEFGSTWLSFDSRIEWLIDLLNSCKNEKVVLICAHAETVMDLRAHLLAKFAIHAATFHEGMEILERDRAAAFFADPEEGTQLLLCSEIGSEGRNFQFSHHLVLFDLPLKPDLLEQRIGRLDRIGQQNKVQIHVPVFKDSTSEFLYRWYHEATNGFEQTSQTGSAVFAKLEKDILAALDDTSLWDKVISDSQSLNIKMMAEVDAGRDKLLEMHSHRESVSTALIESINTDTDRLWVESYLRQYWDIFGVENEQGPGMSTVLHPGTHMLNDYFPSLPESGTTVTFDRNDALAHEDREFITIEHPMMRGAMELLQTSDLGTAALTVIQNEKIKSGTLFLEVLYIVDCPAPPELKINRFLPALDIRLLLDKSGNNLAENISHDLLKGTCLSKNQTVATAVLKSQANLIRELIEKAEKLANEQGLIEIEQAKLKMNEILSFESLRLSSLAKINPNVRSDEVEYLQALPELLTSYIDKTSTRLDSLRVIVVS